MAIGVQDNLEIPFLLFVLEQSPFCDADGGFNTERSFELILIKPDSDVSPIPLVFVVNVPSAVVPMPP